MVSLCRKDSAFCLLLRVFSQLVQEIELKLLDLDHSLPLVGEQVVHLFVQLTNFEFCFEVDLIIVFSAEPIFGLLPVLAHHDDGCLDGGQAGEDEIEQNEREWIKGADVEYQGIDDDPQCDEAAEADEEAPATAKLCDAVGEPFTEGPITLLFAIDIGGECLVRVEAFDDLLFKHREFAFFGDEQGIDVFGAVVSEVFVADFACA